MDCYCDYEAPRLYVEGKPTAKKQHRCSECGRAIEPGEKYSKVFGVWDGWPSTFKTCPRCLSLVEYVKAHVPCVCLAHGGMLDEAIEAAKQYAHEAPGLLFGALRRLVAIKRQPRAKRGG